MQPLWNGGENDMENETLETAVNTWEKELNLKENRCKQRDVNQTKQVVNDLLKAGQPDTKQTGNGAYGLNPRQIVTASANRNMYQNVLRAKKIHLFPGA